jgi:hypothetical protein
MRTVTVTVTTQDMPDSFQHEPRPGTVTAGNETRERLLACLRSSLQLAVSPTIQKWATARDARYQRLRDD